MAEAAARTALVVTASDGANAGVREDTSGAQVAARPTARIASARPGTS
ncbi:MAG: hypothetical protein ACJ77I_01200 [Chloroflexota bacterium]